MQIHKFTSLKHPDLSDYVVHLTGRNREPNRLVDEGIQGMDAEERLWWILEHQLIRGFPVFGTGEVPVVCFSECTPAGIRKLVHQRKYEPVGVAFTKNHIFQSGGGPAWYVRGDEIDQLRDTLPPNLAARAVRLWPGADAGPGEDLPPGAQGESVWWHEREWRLLADGEPAGFRFEPHDIAFLIGPERPQFELPDGYEEVPWLQLSSNGVVTGDPEGIWQRP